MSDNEHVRIDDAGAAQLIRVWLSPSFPVGAFAYSHGLEQAVAGGLVNSRSDLQAWISALLCYGSARTDLVLMAAAWRAVPSVQALMAVNDLALALQPSAERHLETAQQGGSFVATCIAAWPCDALAALRAACPHDTAYPVALGGTAAGHGVGLAALLDAAALAFAQNLVSAAIRLSVIGQTDGQRVTAALMPVIAETAIFASRSDLEDIGAACFSSDLASLEHESLTTRLFRS